MNKALEARNLIYQNIDLIMNNAQILRAEETVTLSTLLDADFMEQHTDLASLAQMFALAGQKDVNQKALEEIPDDVWQDVVTSHSSFESWQDMFTVASQTYVRSRLLEGVT